MGAGRRARANEGGCGMPMVQDGPADQRYAGAGVMAVFTCLLW